MEGDRVVVHHLDLVTRDLSTLVVEGESKLAAPFGLLMRLLRSNENFTSSAVMSDLSWKTMSCLRLHVYVCGLVKSQDSARSATGLPAGRDRQQSRNDVVDHVPRRQVIRACRVVRHGWSVVPWMMVPASPPPPPSSSPPPQPATASEGGQHERGKGHWPLSHWLPLPKCRYERAVLRNPGSAVDRHGGKRLDAERARNEPAHGSAQADRLPGRHERDSRKQPHDGSVGAR